METFSQTSNHGVISWENTKPQGGDHSSSLHFIFLCQVMKYGPNKTWQQSTKQTHEDMKLVVRWSRGPSQVDSVHRPVSGGLCAEARLRWTLSRGPSQVDSEQTPVSPPYDPAVITACDSIRTLQKNQKPTETTPPQWDSNSEPQTGAKRRVTSCRLNGCAGLLSLFLTELERGKWLCHLMLSNWFPQ